MAKLDEIENEVRKVNTGVWSGYDFNGARRSQSPGREAVVAGEETAVFKQFNQFYVSKDWERLEGLAENQIKKTPDWPTPYFFAGIAEIQLGEREAANNKLRVFLSGAADRLDYHPAVSIAEQLLAQAHP